MKKLLTTIFALITIVSFAQNGPGGVGSTDGTSSLVLWLKANDINQISGTAISNWPDASGYGNNATAISPNQPMYMDGVINGHPTINFASTNQQYLSVPHNTAFNSDYVSVFVIGRMNAASQSKGTFLVKTTNKNLSDGFGLIRLNSKEKIRFFAGNYGVNRDSEHIHYGIFDLLTGNFRSNTSNNKIVAMVNNTGSSTTVTGIGSPTSNDLYLGARPGSSGLKSFLDGDISEVVIIADDLPTVDRILIANYLAAKYGFAISNDKYSYHYSHPNQVIGIGKYKDIVHKKSIAGALELKERPASALANGSFIMVGKDNNELNVVPNTGSNQYSKRFDATWRTHVNGPVSKVNLKFHVDGMSLPSGADDYALLMDLDGDGDFSNASVIPANSFNVSQQTVNFKNVHMHTGAVFTLAFYKIITWDGLAYKNGSGPDGAPNQLDGSKDLWVYGPGAVISNNANVNSVKINSSTDLTIDTTICFKIAGAIHNDGEIKVLESASIIQEHEGTDENTGSGSYTLKRTGLNANYGYNNWSSPVKSQELFTAFPDVNPCDLLTFSGYVQNWIYDFPAGYSTTCAGNPVTFTTGNTIVGGDKIMNPGRGYFITGNTTNPQKTFNGQINNGDISVVIYSTELGDNINWEDDDWNLIGNPYPSALDPYAFWMENAVTNQRITDAIYFWDDKTTPGAAYDQYNDYSSWNLTGGIASDNSSKIVDNLNHIASGQGFMVWADSIGVDSGGVIVDTVKFNNSMRSCKNTQFFKTGQNQKELNWLLIENPSGQKSKTLIGTVPGATDLVDNGYDARRVWKNATLEFSTMITGDTQGYVIQGIKPLDVLTSKKHVPLKIVSDEGGIHTISRAAFETAGAPLKIYLKDKQLNVIHDFDNGNYQTHLSANVRYLNRFEIIFEYDGLNNQNGSGKDNVTSIDNINSFFNLVSVKNGFTINSNKGILGNIEVYDIAGHLVYTEVLTAKVTSKTITLSNASGIYIVKVTNDQNESQTQKTLVN
jgi:hypothetical protein